jgi:TPR repeat protein
MAYTVTREELLEKLRDRMTFFMRSVRAYDEGHEAEAVQLAASLRILLHDHRQSRSLLGQLGLKDRLHWVDTAERINPRNLLPTNGLVIIKSTSGGTGTGGAVRYVAPLGSRPAMIQRRPIGFREWWSMEIVKDGHGNLFSRRKLVLVVANKDGGSHVDPQLDDDYAALSRRNSLGAMAVAGEEWSGVGFGGSGIPAEGNPALAAMRQIAYEVEQTVFPQVRWLVSEDECAWFGGPRRRIDRDGPCPCGSGALAGLCCLADPELSFRLGNDLKQADDLDLAIDALQASSDGGHAGAPFNLGLALTDGHDYEGAETAFALGAERGDGEAAGNLGALRHDVGRVDEAKGAWEVGRRLRSGISTRNLGLLMVAEDRLAAKSILEEAADFGDADAAFHAANLCREDGEIEKALKFYGQARYQGHAEATFNHALLLRDAGRPKSGLVALEEAAQSSDEHVANRAKATIQELATEPGSAASAG